MDGKLEKAVEELVVLIELGKSAETLHSWSLVFRINAEIYKARTVALDLIAEKRAMRARVPPRYVPQDILVASLTSVLTS